MEGSFACPECGASVQLAGIAPGRQVRCPFCHRLLEVPYLPRADNQWKRRRFQRPGWVVWAWSGLGIAAVLIAGAGAAAYFKRHQHASQEKSIRKLLESSRRHEQAGRPTEALLDLDAALALGAQSQGRLAAAAREQKKHRADLAQREAHSVIEHLSEAGSSPFPLGEWLNLLARAEADADLAATLPEIKRQFQLSLERAIAAQLAGARRSMEDGKVIAALDICDAAAGLFKHLSAESVPTIRRDAEDLVSQLVTRYGIQIDLPEGQFTFGSQSAYEKEFIPVLTSKLEAKGYLPYRKTSPWKALWDHAGYRIHLQVVEALEGSYLSSANRLTRISADLLLSSGGKWNWHVTPSARSTVPLPRLSALLAGRAAASSERSDEFERMLYADARSHIDEIFNFALTNMPACPTDAGRK